VPLFTAVRKLKRPPFGCGAAVPFPKSGRARDRASWDAAEGRCAQPRFVVRCERSEAPIYFEKAVATLFWRPGRFLGSVKLRDEFALALLVVVASTRSFPRGYGFKDGASPGDQAGGYFVAADVIAVYCLLPWWTRDAALH